MCPTTDSDRVGRPSIAVDEEQIGYLRSLHFSWRKFASLLGVSESTLRRRRKEYTEGNESNWSDITGKSRLQGMQCRSKRKSIWGGACSSGTTLLGVSRSMLSLLTDNLSHAEQIIGGWTPCPPPHSYGPGCRKPFRVYCFWGFFC